MKGFLKEILISYKRNPKGSLAEKKSYNVKDNFRIRFYIVIGEICEFSFGLVG